MHPGLLFSRGSQIIQIKKQWHQIRHSICLQKVIKYDFFPRGIWCTATTKTGPCWCHFLSLQGSLSSPRSSSIRNSHHPSRRPLTTPVRNDPSTRFTLVRVFTAVIFFFSNVHEIHIFEHLCDRWCMRYFYLDESYQIVSRKNISCPLYSREECREMVMLIQDLFCAQSFPYITSFNPRISHMIQLLFRRGL